MEASSRTLNDPTPARIKTHIDTIIKGIFSEGQLDESELTFKDLHFLSENFQRILTGIFHQRIAYPDARIDAAKANGKNGTATAPAAVTQGATVLSPAGQNKACGDKPCGDKTAHAQDLKALPETRTNGKTDAPAPAANNDGKGQA